MLQLTRNLGAAAADTSAKNPFHITRERYRYRLRLQTFANSISRDITWCELKSMYSFAAVPLAAALSLDVNRPQGDYIICS